MAEKKTRPSDEELRDLYEIQKMTCVQIAEIYGCSSASVCFWLKKYGISARRTVDYQGIVNPEGVNTGNVLETTLCPIPQSDLVRFYESPMSVQEIVDHIKRKLNLVFSFKAVLEWLQKSGCVIRTAAQRMRVTSRKYPTVWKEKAQKMQIAAASSEKQKEWAAVHCKKIQPKGVRTRQKQIALVTLRCTWCNCAFEKKPSEVNSSGLNFHSSRCWYDYTKHQNKLAKLRAPMDAILAQREQEAEAYRALAPSIQ